MGSPSVLPLVLLLLLSPALLVLCSNIPPYSCDPSKNQNYDFCQLSLPISARVDKLIAQLTLTEKIAQLGDIAPSIDRLGIPAYKWWSESLHGVSNAGRGIHLDGPIKAATSFPQVILSAATFNPQLWYQIGQVIGTEARAIYNNGQAEGLTFWSPNINIFRDPRWGRGQETPGEDPATTSKYAAVYVRGVQGDTFDGQSTSPELKASACCKHFTAYDLDNWENITRFIFNAQVTAQDLEDTYQPPFRSCVSEGHASGVMCAYNQVNGVPNCASYDFLTKTARGEWGFNGYITSDCGAVAIMYAPQNYVKTPEDAVADVLKAGMDVDCGTYVQDNSASAIQKGKITEQDLDRALHNLFTVRMRLGLFNSNPSTGPFGRIGPDQVCTPEHQNLALEVARDGIVLLKNNGNVLPLSKSAVSSIAVIGPNANNASVLLGNYYGPPCVSVTPLQALQGCVKDTRYLYQEGCNTAACPSPSIPQAVQLASTVDYVILFMGLDQNQEREAYDRVDLVLPGMQQSLISSVAKAARRPVILVLLTGGPVDITFAQSDPKIGAILWSGYPGEAGGAAIAQVLFGEHNPGGRLPVTWYPQEFTRIPMTDMRMRADPASGYPGRTYRFYTGRTVYSFGYGLSYSHYSHRFISESGSQTAMNKTISLQVQAAERVSSGGSYEVEDIDSTLCQKIRFPALVRVKNHGPMDGKNSVLLFLSWPDAAQDGKPQRQLIGFQSLHLRAGESGHVQFDVSPCEHFSRARADGKRVIDRGLHLITAGQDKLQISIMD